ncbi:MAG: hypothetical protein WKF58_08130 [Ilumatobacteraceae bacterium]
MADELDVLLDEIEDPALRAASRSRRSCSRCRSPGTRRRTTSSATVCDDCSRTRSGGRRSSRIPH